MTVGSKSELNGMRRVGRLVADAHAHLARQVKVGITTAELDELGAKFIRARGGRSAPQLTYRFPGFNLISVNDQIVHGVPGGRALQRGDLVKLDITVELDGFVADAARTIAMAGAPEVARRLARCARRAFTAAMVEAQDGRPLRGIGRAIEQEVVRDGFVVVRELTGHGVGRTIHESPAVLNYEDPNDRVMLREGMVLAVEPIITERPARTVEERDGWTIRTRNHALSAHYENTILVQQGRPLILTAA
ncbi:MAG: type I methionyl aminopeptidase [Gemmatimonadaceae bacterium]